LSFRVERSEIEEKRQGTVLDMLYRKSVLDKRFIERQIMYITRIGNKKFWLLMIVIILLISLPSCYMKERFYYAFGSDDWDYTSLPGNYEIWRMNSRDIILVRIESNDSTSRIIERCIVAFCYNDSFIGVKQLEINNDGTVVQSSDSAVFSYYLVDVANDLLLGPYSEEEYYSQILACNAGPMCSWISTDTPPEIGEGGVT